MYPSSSAFEYNFSFSGPPISPGENATGWSMGKPFSIGNDEVMPPRLLGFSLMIKRSTSL